ncbi:uncharacterized protein UHOD_00695 [Ustilago sp. UG-2017b]|nr:uncharacterized protein UHOD_00695 [Ustilago sp. UG-2017b]
MQAGEELAIKAEPDAGVNTASTSTSTEVDLTPPKKRAKSALLDRSLSRDTTLKNPTTTIAETTSSNRANQASSSVTEGAADAWDRDTPAVKVEQETPRPSPAPTPTTQPTSTEDAITIKPDPGTRLPTVSPAPATPSREPSHPPPAKKKKTASTTRKESTSATSFSKSKKSSSTTRKVTSSSSSHPESSSSRTKPKFEETPPFLPPTEEEEDVDNTLYCICQKRQDDVEGGMIMCDRCEQWYHYRCMSMNEADVELVDRFICPPCYQVTGEETTYKKACTRGECRHAARTPFSNYCSDRCGVLALEARFELMKVVKSKGGVEIWETDRRVRLAKRTEGFTVREEGVGTEWEKEVKGMGDGDWPVQRLGVAGAFALMVKKDEETGAAMVNGTPNSIAQPQFNGAATQPSPSPIPSPAAKNDAAPEPSSPSHPSSSSKATSSGMNLISLTEQHTLITTQLYAVDIDKSRINARLDRLDLRSTLLHLVSDRVPTLPPIGSTIQANGTPDPGEEDDEMPDDPSPRKSKKKKGSSKKSKSTPEVGGLRCGYDQRLHWDDAAFDAWAHSEPGRTILAYEKPLDGVLDDSRDADAGAKLICVMAKRKCRRHMDWSNLCEVALDAEKASLNADSRVLIQTKLELVELKQEIEEEMEVVKQLIEQQRRREKRKDEERYRDLAKAVASQGTRRGV